jgi:hypothetical protein
MNLPPKPSDLKQQVPGGRSGAVTYCPMGVRERVGSQPSAEPDPQKRWFAESARREGRRMGKAAGHSAKDKAQEAAWKARSETKK